MQFFELNQWKEDVWQFFVTILTGAIFRICLRFAVKLLSNLISDYFSVSLAVCVTALFERPLPHVVIMILASRTLALGQLMHNLGNHNDIEIQKLVHRLSESAQGTIKN
ncbi:unnamed protein product [Leptidea sinapis]|uniref:Uncharacterized protein n=1 Tax=Leptidea sinapis TaxID=189913 RepID=A0A5E4QLX7_9NEOP|nr:unnamed protein product [Leptidea sinapis]